MRYTVVWLPVAEGELADLWAESSVRQRLTDAVEELERRLGDHPLQLGESRDRQRRIAFIDPIGVTFKVLPDDCFW